MAPERNKRFRDEDLTPAKCVEELLESRRRSREWRKEFNDPNNQRERHLWMFHSNRGYPMSHQIQVQMTTLCDEGLLGRSFYDQFLVVLPEKEWSLRFNQGVRKSVGRFISEGGVLVKDMKAHLWEILQLYYSLLTIPIFYFSFLDAEIWRGRWDPDLKAAAVAAKSFSCIAELICVDEMVELGNRLEAACLSGNDPIEIYGLSWRVMDFYSRANYKLDCLLFLVLDWYFSFTWPPSSFYWISSSWHGRLTRPLVCLPLPLLCLPVIGLVEFNAMLSKTLSSILFLIVWSELGACF